MHIQGPEPLTASMLAAAPHMDQKRLLGLPSFLSASSAASLIRSLIRLLTSVSAMTRRGATLPTDPRPSSKPGWKNHWDAAGDRQLRAAAHAGVARVSTVQGT